MITRKDITLHEDGYWCGGSYYSYKDLRLCSVNNPTIVLSTQNENERTLRHILPQIEGAKLLLKKVEPWYKYDNYERRIPCGSVSYEIWDLREVFGCTKSLGSLLDYVECCQLGIEDKYHRPKKCGCFTLGLD